MGYKRWHCLLNILQSYYFHFNRLNAGLYSMSLKHLCNFRSILQWRIQGSGLFYRPFGPISFIFIQFSVKTLPNNRAAPLSGLGASLENPVLPLIYQTIHPLPPPDSPNSFIFMQFLVLKKLQNNRSAHPLWELGPPQENPGSAAAWHH